MNMYFLASSPRESTEICKDPSRPACGSVPTPVPMQPVSSFPSLSQIIMIPRPRGLVLKMIKTHLYAELLSRGKKKKSTNDETFFNASFFFIFSSLLFLNINIDARGQ